MDSADIFAVHLNHDTEELRHGLQESVRCLLALVGLKKAGMVRRLLKMA